MLLFVFVLIHELGHATTALARGVRAEKIILFPLGGGAHIPDRPKRVLDEVLVYAAGPGANLLVAAIALPVLLTNPYGELILRSTFDPTGNFIINPGLVDRLLSVTVAVNVLLAAGNLLPAFPLDGGRILHALLRGKTGERTATVIISVLGILIGIALIYLSYRLGDPLLGLGAGFVISMSIAALRGGWQRRRLAKLKIDELVRSTDDLPLTNRLYTSDQAVRAVQAFEVTNWPVLPVYDNWNDLRGFVSDEAVKEEDPTGAGPLLAVAELEFVTAKPGENLLTVTERIVEANVYGAAVYGQRGRLIGFIFTEDVMSVLGKE